jgi:hypothetical protein
MTSQPRFTMNATRDAADVTRKQHKEENSMGLSIKASDLKYKYPRSVITRHEPKFQGKNDPASFNRDDLYDIIPLFEAVMDELGRDDARTLHILEDLLNVSMPRFIITRGEVFDFMIGSMEQLMAEY